MRRLHIEPPSLTEAEVERIEHLAGLSQVGPALTQALNGLSDDQRTAVELRVVHELDYAEVAARLHVSQDVARARVSRGLRTLAGRLEGRRREMSSAL